MRLKDLFGAIVEKARAADLLSSRRGAGLVDRLHYRSLWTIGRWASDEDRERKSIYPLGLAIEMFRSLQFTAFDGNVLLNEGINELWTILCSSSGTKFDSANANIGVGESSAGEDPSHTDLQGSTKTYKGMMATFPTYGTSQKAIWKSEFLSAEANNVWAEFTVSNTTSGTGKNLNRKVSAQGTKTAGQVWECTLQITLS